MKQSGLFNYDLLFGDYMSKCSNEARLYYIKIMFYANNGFVANPMGVLDSMGYDRSVYQELVDHKELLVLPDRCEVFITSYFVHNRFKPMSWMSSPFAIYWKNKLYIKKNGVATFNPQGLEEEPKKPNVGEQIVEQTQTKNYTPVFSDEIQLFKQHFGNKKYSDLNEEEKKQWYAILDGMPENNDLPF